MVQNNSSQNALHQIVESVLKKNRTLLTYSLHFYLLIYKFIKPRLFKYLLFVVMQK